MRLAVLAALVSVAVAASGLAACGGSSQDTTLTPVADRAQAKDFTVPALDGGTVHLASFAGTPVVLNFWASWCIPCKKETPELIAFQKAHPDVKVVGVAVNDEPPDSRAFAKRFAIPYPLGSDPDAKVGTDTYEIPGLPSTFVIDAKGRIAAAPTFGPVTGDYLDGVAKALQAEATSG